MKRVKIFEPCDMDYKEYDKPVRYTEDFLKDLAARTIGTKLVKEEHLGEEIGNVTNITFTDGALWADVSTDEALDNLKFSPSYDSTLVDDGNYWVATKGKLLEVALTSKPRERHIWTTSVLNNTAEDNGGSKMGEKNNDGTLEFFQNEVKRLQQENNKLDFKLNQANDKIKGFEEKETELEELRAWKETNEKVLEEQKPIVEQYKKYQETKHEELLEKASKGNPEIKEKLKDFKTEDLEILIGLETEEQPAEGVGASNAPGLNEGDGSDDESDEDKAQKDLEIAKSMFSELNKEE